MSFEVGYAARTPAGVRQNESIEPEPCTVLCGSARRAWVRVIPSRHAPSALAAQVVRAPRDSL